ncbi:hypothetical protein F5Y18DRAFT_419836 [Xylariaceae sp. FL1019]|nr:hypothetical protein F5Y18DRAFT_419836 [Xylariaceae sp. FL1019]
MLAHSTYPSRNHQPNPFYFGQQPQSQQQQQRFPQQQQHFSSFSRQPQQSTDFSTTLENIPAAAAAIAATQRYRSTPATLATIQSLDQSNAAADLMPSDPWMLQGQPQQQQQQTTPRHTQRFGHQRDSSLSSAGSNTPASPFSSNTANPQIAVTDSLADGLPDITGVDSNYTYALAKPLPMGGNFYTSALGPFAANTGISTQNVVSDVAMADGLPALTGAQQHPQRQRGLAPAPDLAAGGSTRSRPVSVASSVGGDSPATPSFHEAEDEGRRSKNAYANGVNPPKLNRTITDVYNDELYNPNFTITSASPSPQTQMAMSPSNELFAQRLQAANSQHLSAAQSPVSSMSRDRSPFRQGSPYASAIHEFPKGSTQARLESAQQQRERRKAEQDAKALQQQLARNNQDAQSQQQQQGTPNTMSPQDAVLEFNDLDADSNFPLFPPNETGNLSVGDNSVSGNMNMMKTASQQPTSTFQSMSATPMQSAFNFSMPSNVQVPQQYPFVGKQPTQQQQSTPSASSFSRMSSAEASTTSVSNSDGPIQRPARTPADRGGTYTCTYHGCTLRFETPALLQKHKREGHRQANALNHLRNPTHISLSPTNPANSQAGPHRCERINPSTGKPCNTVFSRPYDLTRHEDTIHNARKQKVRCDLCTEEKTFSRADALTRHYRVCHPDMELPGKHRRRLIG